MLAKTKEEVVGGSKDGAEEDGGIEMILMMNMLLMMKVVNSNCRSLLNFPKRIEWLRKSTRYSIKEKMI
jgi:hypothetical protein